MHTRGPTKFYRRECYLQIAPLPEILGWDGMDDVSARLHGWDTCSFEIPGGDSIHLRPTGTHNGALRANRRWGLCAYAVGAHPMFATMSGIARFTRRPYVIGGLNYIVGYLRAGMRRAPRAEPAVIRQSREEELRRVLDLGRALPARRRSVARAAKVNAGLLRSKAPRFLASALDPRAWFHIVRMVHFHNYSYVQQIRKATLGHGVSMPPDASLRNGDRIAIGARSHFSPGCSLWAGDKHGRITIGEDVLFGPDVFLTASNYQTAPGIPMKDQPRVEADIVIGSDVGLALARSSSQVSRLAMDASLAPARSSLGICRRVQSRLAPGSNRRVTRVRSG